jgi:hypothetical protein
LAIYSVVVAKGSQKNFFDGIQSGIWGFTSQGKLLPKKQKAPVKGDFVVFGFALHQNAKVTKGGFPRVDTLEKYLYHYQPFAEILTLTQITDVLHIPDHSKVIGDQGEEIWVHTDTTPEKHKFPYRIKLRVLETYDECDFINDKLHPDVVEGFRLSSADVGSLRLGSSSNKLFISGLEENSRKVPPLSNVEPKATSKHIDVETSLKNKHKRKGTEDHIASRSEGILVKEYCAYLARKNVELKPLRTQITMPNGTNLYTDLTILDKLIEAKSDVSRNSIRTAIGQLYDYECLLDAQYKKAILVPSLPEDSLCRLIKKLGFSVIYKRGSDFFEVHCHE